MKKRFYHGAALIGALALLLSLTGCGGADVGVIGGADGPTSIIIATDETQIVIDGQEAPPADTAPAEEPAEDLTEVPAEDPGTGNSEADLPYDDTLTENDGAALDEDGTYNSAEDVSLYLYLYGHLPDNYITKSEAREKGWSGGSVEQVAPGCAIGGDRFGNREGVLPKGSYHECDIDTIGQSSRGAKRLVYEDGGDIYYTEDHYETFTQLAFLTGEDGSLTVVFGEE